ncbi:MAG: EpsI family protein [Myxococcales bacterium]|nr:EpsI family protein [Myxococcales bacterium]
MSKGSGRLMSKRSREVEMGASEGFLTQRFLRVTAIAVGCLAYWRLLFWVPTRDLSPLNAWLFLTTDPFPQAIFLIVAALVYRRRESFRSAMRFRGSPALAALPLLAGSSLFAWGHYVDAMDLVLVSFMLVSIGAGLLWFGVRFARALAIPWVVLAFAFPAPGVVTNQAFYALRLSTAAHATALLQFVGVPALREGNVIFGSEVIAQVVDTCSGLRSMEMLALAAIFFVGWFPARRLRQVLVVVLAPAIAYLFNIVRVGVMAVAPTSEFSANHAMQGLAVFFGAITCLILVDRVLGRLLPARPKANRASGLAKVTEGLQPDAEPESNADAGRGLQLEARSESNPGPELQLELEPESSADLEPESAPLLQGIASSKGRLGAASLAALAVTMLGVSIWMPQWIASESKRLIPARPPAKFDGWTKTEKIGIDRGFLWTMRFQRGHHHYWNYERNGDEVSVFIGYDDRRRRGRSLLSRKNAVPRRGWEVEERSSVSLESIDARVERAIARSDFERALTYHWYEGTDGMASEILRALLATDQSRFRRSEPARVIRVAIALGSTPLAWKEDETKLRGFAASLVTALRK